MKLRSLAIAVTIAVTAAVFVVVLERRNGGDETGRPQQIAPAPSVNAPVPAIVATAPEVSPNDAALAAPDSVVRTEPHVLSALGIRLEPVVSPEWSSEMEARILNHVSLYPGVSLKNLQVQCVEEQCMLLMQATSPIDVFQFEFDEFAKTNGFQNAVIGTADGDTKIRIVTLRR